MIVSSIRIKKFCSNSLFDSSVGSSGFSPKYDLKEALRKTIKHEFKKEGIGLNKIKISLES